MIVAIWVVGLIIIAGLLTYLVRYHVKRTPKGEKKA